MAQDFPKPRKLQEILEKFNIDYGSIPTLIKIVEKPPQGMKRKDLNVIIEYLNKQKQKESPSNTPPPSPSSPPKKQKNNSANGISKMQQFKEKNNLTVGVFGNAPPPPQSPPSPSSEQGAFGNAPPSPPSGEGASGNAPPPPPPTSPSGEQDASGNTPPPPPPSPSGKGASGNAPPSPSGEQGASGNAPPPPPPSPSGKGASSNAPPPPPPSPSGKGASGNAPPQPPPTSPSGEQGASGNALSPPKKQKTNNMTVDVPQDDVKDKLDKITEQLMRQEDMIKSIGIKKGDQPNIPIINTSPQPNQPSMFTKLLSSEPTFIEDELNGYLKEFEEFKKKMITRIGTLTTRSSEDGILNNIGRQISIIRSKLNSKTPEQMKAGYKEILRIIKSSSDLFDKKNRQFLIDAGFLRKVQILLDYERRQNRQNRQNQNFQNGGAVVKSKNPTPLKHKYYSEAAYAFNNEVIAKFYNELEKELMTNFNMSSNTLDKDELEEERNKLLDELSKKREKLYALYNNNISLMDVLNQTFIAVYLLKGLRIFFTWFATFTASKVLQEKYVAQVFANNEDPPDLRLFVVYFIAIEIAFILALMIFLMLLKFLFDKQGDFIINGNLIKKFATDYIINTMIVIVITVILASVIMSKKYFRYKTDGLRAIRSLQTLAFYITTIISVIPFFLIV
jgi:hypothetical protein